VTTYGVWIGNRLYCTLTLVTTNNYARDYRKYSTHKVLSVFGGWSLVTASNGGSSRSSGFPNGPCPQSPAPLSNSSRQLHPSRYITHYLTNQLSTNYNEMNSKSELCYGGQSVILFRARQPIWGPRPDFCCSDKKSEPDALELLLALASPVIFGSEPRGTR
jgi:hypothetical protein